MSVSKKVLRKMKKVMGVIGAIPVLASCSSQISRAEVNVGFDPWNKVLYFSGKDGVIDSTWKERYNSDSIRRVVIDDGVEEIGDRAFSDCTSLEEITIPNSVTSIGEEAFSGCRSLKEITIPNSVEKIGKFAFFRCESLQNAEILGDVKTIEIGTFKECGLRKFKVPKSVVTIREDAFRGCYELSEVECEEDDSSKKLKLGKFAFQGCKSLKKFDASNRSVYVNGNAFDGCLKTFAELGGKVIKGCNCSRDGEPVIDLSLRGEKCVNVKSIGDKDIVTRVMVIGNVQYRLDGKCLSIKGNGTIEKGSIECFLTRKQKKKISEIRIDKGITGIGNYAFAYFFKLKHIYIPNSVNTIGNYAFYDCKSLEEITIPNSVNIIDEFAFAASGLERVKFEDMSRRDSESCWDVLLNRGAFSGCKQLGILDLGNVTNSRNVKVEGYAFCQCDSKFRELEGGTVVRGKVRHEIK